MKLLHLVPYFFAALSGLRGASISFEFSTDGALPSSQGASYTGLGISEVSAFTASGGQLAQRTVGGVDVLAFYDVPAVFDPATDATIEWRARVLAGSGLLGANVQLMGGGRLLHFFMNPGGVFWVPDLSLPAVPGGASFDGTQFHTYLVQYTASTGEFVFHLDGSVLFSGSVATVGSSANLLGWGDATPTGGNADVDWDYLRLTNSADVAEPSVISLVVAGLSALRCLGARRGRAGRASETGRIWTN